MKYFIRLVAQFATQTPTTDPSNYTDDELKNGKDGIWQCGESSNPEVFGTSFVCGGECGSSSRRRRDLSGKYFYMKLNPCE